MFASRRAISMASGRLSCRASRSIAQPARRFYATTDNSTASSPSTTTTTTEETNNSKPKPTSTTAFKPKPKPTVAAATPLSHSDVVYTPRSVGYSVPLEGAESSPPEIAGIDWSRSYHGISIKPVTEKQFKMLMEPLEEKDIEVKPDGIIYLPEIKYRRKLNEIFGPMGWGIIPKGEAVVGDSIVTREYALIIDGRFVSQAQGENSYFSPDQLPSAVEGCKSNALMRCCKDIGIGSELWDPQFIRWFKKNHLEEVWVEHATTKKKRTFWYKKGMVEVAYPYKVTSGKFA